MGGKIYVKEYKEIGPLMVHIKDRTAKIMSILGNRCYSFPRLPRNYNNYCAILRYSVMHYFAEILDTSEAVSKAKAPKLVERVFRFFSSQPRLPEGASAHERLCLAVHNNIGEYDGEDVTQFMEYNGPTTVSEALQDCPLAAFINFGPGFFPGQSGFEITPLDLERLRAKNCTLAKGNADALEVLEFFVVGELNYFAKLISFKEAISHLRLGEDEAAGFLGIVEAHEALARGIRRRFRAQAAACGEAPDVCNETIDRSCEPSEEAEKPTIASLVAFLLDNFHLFFAYERFMGSYDQVLGRNPANYELRSSFTTIIQKITGYPQLCRMLLKCGRSPELETLYLKFSRLNQMLNKTAEMAFLEEKGRGLAGILNLEQTPPLLAYTQLQEENSQVVDIYLLADWIVFTIKGALVGEPMGLGKVEMCIYDRKLFLFAEQNKCDNRLFSRIPAARLWTAALRFDNRETIVEFVRQFYSLKHQAHFYEGIYCTDNPGIHIPIWVTRVGPGENGNATAEVGGIDSAQSLARYKVTVEYADLQIGGVAEMTEPEMLSKIHEMHGRIAERNEKTTEFLVKQRVLLEGITERQLKPPSLYFYNEDSVSSKAKEKLFWELCGFVAGRDDNTPAAIDTEKFQAENKATLGCPVLENDKFFNSILYEEDVLKNYCPENVKLVLSHYMRILHPGLCLKELMDTLTTNMIDLLFIVFLQRNIYAFFAPGPLGLIATAMKSDSPGAVGIPAKSKKYISAIVTAARRINNRSARCADELLRIIAGEFGFSEAQKEKIFTTEWN